MENRFFDLVHKIIVKVGFVFNSCENEKLKYIYLKWIMLVILSCAENVIKLQRELRKESNCKKYFVTYNKKVF